MIEILAAGPLATVQDLGRPGYRRYGIGTSGAMDPLAFRAGNRMLGNPDGAAAIEVTATGFRCRFLRPARFAVTGAALATTLDDAAIPPWWASSAAAGQILDLSTPRAGMRAYIAVSGGIDVPAVMGSRSTDLKGGFGGFEARSLASGDVLPVGPPADAREVPDGGFGVRSPPRGPEVGSAAPTVVRVIPAAEYGLFTDEALEAFWSRGWTVGADSNRLGLRLAGPALAFTRRVELLSHGLVTGVVQVPPSGQPMIQAMEANTCGGYPKIGVVIGADLWRVGQVRIGGKLRFSETTTEEAMDAAAENEAFLERVARAARTASALGRGGR